MWIRNGAASGLTLAFAFGALAACSADGAGTGPMPSASAPSSASPSEVVSAAPSPDKAPPDVPLLPREGQAIARSASGEALYVAQQDLSSLLVLPLPLSPAEGDRPTSVKEVPLPGRPAQVLVMRDRVIVTVRDPGLVMVFQPDLAAGLVETARIQVPADAFGLALSPGEKMVLVTSAWTHAVTAIDLAGMKLLWTIDVAREPRGITVTRDSKRAFVTHLVGTDLTRIDGLSGTPAAVRIHLPAAPLRRRAGVKEDATLAYTGVLSPDGSRLFVPRHALGAEGKRAWNGQAVVDVLLTADDSALAQPATKWVKYSTPELEEHRSFGTGRGPFRDLTFGGGFPFQKDAFIAPRGAVYRQSKRTLLVASEGTDALVELDALAIEPAAHVLARHRLRGRLWVPKAPLERAQIESREDGVLYTVLLEDGRAVRGYDENKLLDGVSGGVLVGIERRKRGSAEVVIRQREPDDMPGATKCGAPSGVALSADEKTAWVLCRTTFGVAEVRLDPDKDQNRIQTITPKVMSIGKDPLPAEAALGRRLFFNAWDGTLSGGFACANCHPEGRDDGHVWQEMIDFSSEPDTSKQSEREPCATYLATPIWPFFFDMVFEWKLRYGYPRQTPMLAGRLARGGPFGWHGKSPDLLSRVIRGSAIHGWTLPEFFCGGYNMKSRASAIAAFARTGLVPPPHESKPLTEQEQRGKAVFEDSKAGCASCHAPKTGYTDRSVVPFAAPPPVFDKNGPVKSFEDETDRMFKTPSLLFVGGTPPYFHDGTAATLEEVIEKNKDRMGKTSHLSAEDKAALVAFLRTL